MTSFLLRCSGFALIQLVIAWVLISKALEPASEENAYLAAILDKRELITDNSQARVITVGGSNVAFGFDSKALGSRLDRKPVNFGLHAALGMHFPLNFVEAHVRQGDMVILSIEFTVLGSPAMYGEPAHVQQLLGYWPGAKPWFETDFSWKRFMDREALDLLHQWVVRGKRRLKGDAPQVIQNVYQRCNFNEFGDMVGHYGHSPKPWQPTGAGIQADSVDRAILRLNRFHEACLKKGAKVYYSSPPVSPARLALLGNKLSGLETTLSQRMTIPVVNSADEMVFQKDEFYDSQYHLTQAAASRRSRAVANGILKHESQRSAGLPKVWQ